MCLDRLIRILKICLFLEVQIVRNYPVLFLMYGDGLSPRQRLKLKGNITLMRKIFQIWIESLHEVNVLFWGCGIINKYRFFKLKKKSAPRAIRQRHGVFQYALSSRGGTSVKTLKSFLIFIYRIICDREFFENHLGYIFWYGRLFWIVGKMRPMLCRLKKSFFESVKDTAY